MQLTVPPMGGQLQIVKLAEPGDAAQSRRRRRRVRRGRAGVQPRAGALRSAARGAGDRQGRRRRRRCRPPTTKWRCCTRATTSAAPSSTPARNELVGAIKAQTERADCSTRRSSGSRSSRPTSQTHRETTARLGRRPAREAQQGAARRCRSPSATSRACASARRSTASSSIAHELRWRSAASAFPGIAMPDYRVGDAAFAGQPIADVIDTSQIEVTREAVRAGSRERRAGPDGRSRRGRAAGRDAARHGAHGQRRRVARIFDAGTRQFDIAFDVTGQSERCGPASRPRSRSPGRRSTTSSTSRGRRYSTSAGKPTVYVRTGGRLRRARRSACAPGPTASRSSRTSSRRRRLRSSIPNAPSGTRRAAGARRPRGRRDDARGRARIDVGALAARSRAQRRQPAPPQAAHAADDARHDLRRRGGAWRCCRSAPARSSR